MNNNLKRIVSLLLLSSLNVFGISSCLNNNSIVSLDHNTNMPKYISENDEWWNSAEFSVVSTELSFDINSPDVMVNSNLRAVTDNSIYVYFGGYEYSGELTKKINEVACFSIEPGNEGSLIGVIDLNSTIQSDEGFINDVVGVFEDAGYVKMLVDIQYMDSRGLCTCLCDVSFKNNTASIFSELKFAEGTTEQTTINDAVYMNGTVFLKCYTGSEACIYTLKNGICQKINVENFEFINTFEKYDECNIIMCVTSFGKTKYMLLNTDTYKLSEISDYKGYYKIIGHCLVTTNGTGNENEILLDFNDSYVSFMDYYASEILSVSDNRVIIKSNNSDNYDTVIVLNKADTNPNAGKQIIEAAHLDYLTSLESEGISKFNKLNQKYLVIDNEDYNYWNVFNWDAANVDYDAEKIRAQVEVVNQLMVDITAGDGPDIILGSAEFREIQNGTYLVDIEPYISNLKLSSDQYFTNIIDAADIDGRKYVLPYDVTLCGILVNKNDAEEYGDGIKIQDYGRFVNDVCNGNDPMCSYSDKMSYFIQLTGTSFDLYETSDGLINFDNNDFRALAEYVKNNVPEQITYTQGAVRTASLGSVSIAFEQFGLPLANKEMIGMPSPDGRGIYCYFNASASITVCSSCQDGCWEFISSMLNDDILKYANAIPVSKAAFRSLAVTFDYTPIDQNVLDNYEVMITKSSFYYSIDYTITKIILEEMPAYFEGQKSLDDVIAIINNRVGTLVSERK